MRKVKSAVLIGFVTDLCGDPVVSMVVLSKSKGHRCRRSLISEEKIPAGRKQCYRCVYAMNVLGGDDTDCFHENAQKLGDMYRFGNKGRGYESHCPWYEPKTGDTKKDLIKARLHGLVFME